MEIQKGKLYFDSIKGEIFKCAVDQNYIPATDNIAVHCPTIEDLVYVRSKYGRGIHPIDEENTIVYLDTVNWETFAWETFTSREVRYHLITIEQFKEFYPEEEETTEGKIVEDTAPKNVFDTITASIADLLKYKNEKYGNSALQPLKVFEGKAKVGQRLDDKLARIKNSDTLKKNDVADLIGYLTLVCVENNWTDFSEFKD